MSEEDLTAESEDDSDLIKKLRKALKASSSDGKKAREEAAEALAKAQSYERDKMFDEAGVPKAARALMQKALSDVEDLDVDKIRSEAAAAGIVVQGGPAPEAGQGEVEMHAAAASAAGDAPAPPPGIEDRIRQAATKEEVLALAMEGGMPTVVQ